MNDLQNDIEKYLRGDLTAREMHLLEKRALNDPFLADALEGASSLGAADFSEDIKYVQQSVRKRVEQKSSSIWLWSARIAAGVIILSITGYIAFNLIDKNESKTELALSKSESPAIQPMVKETPVQDSPTITEPPKSPAEPIKPKLAPRSESIIDESNAYATGVSKDEKKPIDVAPQNEPVETHTSAGEVAKWAETKQDREEADYKRIEDAPAQLADKLNKDENEGREKKAKSMASNAPAGVVYKSVIKKELRVLQGKVIDEDGSPMPGVSVALKGSELGTITDEEGNYKLSLNDDPHGELVFSFIGMQRAEVPIIHTDSINAKLTPDFAELSEVVVVGYGSEGDDDGTKENVNVYQPASPEGGKKEYKNYLVQNLKYPEQAIESKVQGKVTIQFVIESNGNVNDFRVVKGIGHGCDEEVIRLIKQGPKWIPTKRNDIPTKGRVKVRLKFTLPE